MTTELKLSVPLWYPGLTSEDRLKNERIQKSACCIILGQEYQSYRRAWKQLDLDTWNIPARFCEVYARTERFKQSPISYLTNILNNQ